MPTSVFSTQDSRYLAEKIAAGLSDAHLHDIERATFDDGEQYYRLKVAETQLIDEDVIFVASTHTDDNLLETFRLGSGLAAQGTRRRLFVIPYFGYSTMERAVQPGEIVTAKKNALLLSAIPNTGLGNAFIMFDLHTPGLVHYFEGESLRYELSGQDILAAGLEKLGLENIIFGSADLGRPRRIQELANRFATDIAFVSKQRTSKGTAVTGVIGEVAGKTVVIYDDMVRSGGSLAKAAAAYLNEGARAVYALISHLALTEGGVEILEQSPLTHLISTDSHPMSQDPRVVASSRITICETAPMFAQALAQFRH